MGYSSQRRKRILVLGTGSGWDTLTWAAQEPERIYAVEKFSFQQDWQTVSAYARNRALVVPEFVRADIGLLPVRSGSVNLVVSDAVFEHCQDMPAVAREIYRVLTENGIAYASYGPMWYCFGGDHFSGRGGLATGFNHLCLTKNRYRDYKEKHRRTQEDAQSGLRYGEIDLFSRKTTREYLDIFESVGFEVLSVVVEVSSSAVEFRKTWPERFLSIVEDNPGITADDLLIKGNLVVLRKSKRT